MAASEVISDGELAEYYRIPRELSYHAEVTDERTLPKDNLDFTFRYRAIERALDIPRDRPLRALDVGCGSGLISLNLARAYPNLAVVGLDFNPVQMRYAAAYAQRVGVGARMRYAAADANALPIRGPFDLVLCTEVLEHLPRALDVVRRFRELVAPAGRLVVTLPQVNVHNPGLYLFVGVDEKGTVQMETHDPALIPSHLKVMRFWHKLYTLAEARALLAEGGFRVKHVAGINWRFPPAWPGVSFAIRRTTRSAALDMGINRLFRQRFAGNLVLVCEPEG